MLNPKNTTKNLNDELAAAFAREGVTPSLSTVLVATTLAVLERAHPGLTTDVCVSNEVSDRAPKKPEGHSWYCYGERWLLSESDSCTCI